MAALVAGTQHSVSALDIANGDYSKNDPRFVRIMTWNVAQHLGDASEPSTPWTATQLGSPLSAVNLVIEALDPDVLLLQECGDIPTNISASTVLVNMQAWRNQRRPGYSLVVGTASGSLQNSVLSRWPLRDLNGDGRVSAVDIPVLSPGASGQWPQGGNGGIRGWVQAEIDLPDASYPGDLYVGASHFKALSGFDDERIRAAQNIAAYIQSALNTSGDPLNIIPDFAQPPQPLSALTPVVWAGDFNAVDSSEPLEAMRRNDPANANDGTDRDGGPVWRSDAAPAYNGSTYTYGTGSHLDYVFVQDQIASVNAAFVFDTQRMPRDGTTLRITQGAPPNMASLFQSSRISAIASDHYPVVVDLEMPAPARIASVSITGLAEVASGGLAQYQGVAQFTDGSQTIVTQQGAWSVEGPAQIVTSNGRLTAGVVGINTPAVVTFEYESDGEPLEGTKNIVIRAISCTNRGDVNGDGRIDGDDVSAFVAVLLGADVDVTRVCRSNVDANAALDSVDVIEFVGMLLGHK